MLSQLDISGFVSVNRRSHLAKCLLLDLPDILPRAMRAGSIDVTGNLSVSASFAWMQRRRSDSKAKVER